MSQIAGTLVSKVYSNFRGVDFSNKEIAPYRSPDALNMWKNYKQTLGKCVETRPDIELYQSYDNTVFGIYFYDIGNVKHMIVHCGVKLFDVANGVSREIHSQMNTRRSNYFIYNQILYIQDGIHYLEYDGVTCRDVIGFIPTTSISRKAMGGGERYQDVNLLTGVRKNTFCADGESTEYYLDTTEIDNDFVPVVIVNDEQLVYPTDFSVDSVNGVISFIVPPDEPLTEGQDNVSIMFRKTINGYRNRIDKCTLLSVFDNRVFFSGNPDYPNVVYHSTLNDPTYIRDTDYYNEGLDLSPVKSLIAGNNALWVLKAPSQANTTIFYHNPVIDSDFGKIYPSIHSSISTGCVATGINFNDDIVFFSERGLEGITGDVTTEQAVKHKSSLVDSKLLNETNYNKMILEEYEGYLLVIIGNKVYLADSRQKVTIEDHVEYEWYYWELSKNIICSVVKDGVLYLGTEDGIYTLTKTNNLNIQSYWTTCNEVFNYSQYMKTTNKKGFVVDMQGSSITLYARTDNNAFESVGTYTNTKGYIPIRLKKKKWKSLQLKFSSSSSGFGLYLVNIEAYVGGYIKR